MSKRRRPIYDVVSPAVRRATIQARLHRHAATRHVLTRKVSIPANLGIRLVLVADFHADHHFMPRERVAAIVEQINAVQDVDLVAIPGDFVGHAIDALDAVAAELGRLRSRTFASLGNHDHYEGANRVTDSLEQHGIAVLTNSSVELDNDVSLVGLDSCEAGIPTSESIERLITRPTRTIVLGHEPFLATRHRAALHLAGHTHHGQIRIPGVPLRYLPKFSRPYPEGLATITDAGCTRWVYTTAGVGSTTLPIRIGAPPEIVVIDA